MSVRHKPAKRSMNGTSHPNRKIAPVIANAPVHSVEVDDRKTASSKNFKEDKLTAGIRASNKHDYTEAVKQFSLIKPDTTISLYLTGCVRLELRYYAQTKEAIHDFTNCIALASHDKRAAYSLEVWFKRAQTYHTLRRYNEALTDYTEFINRCKLIGTEAVAELHRGLIGRGQTYQAMYELDMAMQDMNEANRLANNNDPFYLCCRASVYVSKQERGKAFEDIKRASDIGCDQDVEALIQRGIVYTELGRHNTAVEDFSKALKLTPKPAEQSDICYRCGMSLYILNNKREALTWFERAITIHSFNAQAYYRLGMMQREKGQYKEALKSLNRAHELAPEEGDILLERAIVYEHLGNLQDATTDRKRGEQLNSSSSAVMTTLDDRIKKAHEERNRTGSTPRNHLELAMAYDGLINQKKDLKIKLEYYKTAKMEYHAAIQDDTTYLYPQAYALLALCQKKMNDLNEAHELHLEFYSLLDREKEAVYHWKTFLSEIQDKMEAGKLDPNFDENTVSKLTYIEVNRRKKDVDVQTFQNDLHDQYQNQLAFYKQMRIDLTNLLAAIAILNLDADTIIDNVEDTTNKVGKIIKLICEGERSIPTIESVLHSNEKVNGGMLRKIDYNMVKMKLRSLGNVGDMIDQLDIAQLVARHLCIRYHSQFICLIRDTRHSEMIEVQQSTPSSSWWKCCGSSESMLPKQTTYGIEKDSIRKISTFAIASIVQAINKETIRVSIGRTSGNKDALGTSLVLIVCQAHLNIETQRFGSDHHGNRNLPINLTLVSKMLKKSKVPNVDETISSIQWDLYDFFRAPGIYYHSDDGTEKIHYSGSILSMIPSKYGYRLGTKEEVDVFKRFK